MHRLNALQLRDTQPTPKQLQELKKTRRELYLILDSVQDTYNIGGLFRLADATGVKKIYLCGKTECPPNTRIHKAAVGLENWIDWEYHANAAELIKQLKSRHPELDSGSTQIPDLRQPADRNDDHGAPTFLAIEQSKNSLPLSKLPKPTPPIYLVLGHETHGVSKNVLQLCDHIVELPMHGVNISLNVIIAASVVLYHPSISP
jgi:tRNA G18 (ribose-2'-O)-methylase SpoU